MRSSVSRDKITPVVRATDPPLPPTCRCVATSSCTRRASAVTRLAHGAGRCNLVELEASRLLEAQGELRDLVGQVHDVVALPQVEGEEWRHAHVVEAEGNVVTSAEEELAQPRGLVGAHQPVRLELEDHEAITIAELRAPRNADETTRGKTAREVALPLEAHEWRAPSHGLGGEA